MSSRYYPVSISVFQTELLKGPNLGARELRKLGDLSDVFKMLDKPKRTPTKSGQGLDMYPGVLCETLNKVINLADSTSVFRTVLCSAESKDIDHCPGLAMYPTHGQAAAAYTLTGEPAPKTKTKVSRTPHAARCAYQWMITAIEVKPDGMETGFGFKPGEPLLRRGDEASEARKQFAKYATEIMLRQHRTHLFLFYIAGSYARVFCWDRNGAVVSQPINLATDFKQLLNFVYRLARANGASQGYDSTVSLAKDSEVAKLRDYKPETEYLEGYKTLMLDNTDQFPIFKVESDEVLDPDAQRKTRASRRKRFLVGKCLSGECNLIGRCTKAWVCYSLDDDKMLFMKEQWRSNVVGIHPEIETYMRLRKHRVEYVATAVAGGDVIDSQGAQKTVSQRFINNEDIDVPERIHTRLVIKEIGRPLDTYSFSGELIAVVRQALKGHQQAWEKAGVLHRDISVGNILIDTVAVSGHPPGFLIDWDLCKYKEELDTTADPSETGVSGTWPFNSALSLQYPRKPKELADDLESFVYIVTYCAFRWHRHESSTLRIDNLIHATQREQQQANRGNQELAVERQRFFYREIRHKNGLSSGGDQKLLHIRAGCLPLSLLDTDSPLSILLKKLFNLLGRHYKTVNMKELVQYRAERFPSPEPTPSLKNDRGTQVYRIIPLLSDTSSNRATAPRPPTPPTPSEKQSSTSQNNTRPRPLDNHKEIIGIFSSVLRDKRGRPLNLAKYLQDKTYDQFYVGQYESSTSKTGDSKNPPIQSDPREADLETTTEEASEDQPKAPVRKRKATNRKSEPNRKPQKRARARA